MTDIANCFIADTAERDADERLSLRARALVIMGLGVAAWVPILLPIYLFFVR